jgi:hypothetical protein
VGTRLGLASVHPREGRRGPPRFDDLDAIESPWGRLWPGQQGHYAYGFRDAVVAKITGDTVKVTLSDGTVWTFGGSDRVVEVPSTDPIRAGFRGTRGAHDTASCGVPWHVMAKVAGV